jgi:hypothetical protein
MGYPTVCELARFKIFERSEVCSEGWWFGGPSLKQEFVVHLKPMELHVLNDLGKHNDRLTEYVVSQ